MPLKEDTDRLAHTHTRRSAGQSRSSGSESKDEAVVALSFRFKKDVHDRLKIYCFAKGVSQNEFVAGVVEGRLKEVMDGIMEQPIRTLLSM